MELIPNGLTAMILFMVFGVWLGLVSLRSLVYPVLYLHEVLHNAVPKYISERTSYLRVRLAFYLYPQLIPALCSVHGFGPSRDFTLASTWP